MLARPIQDELASGGREVAGEAAEVVEVHHHFLVAPEGMQTMPKAVQAEEADHDPGELSEDRHGWMLFCER